MFYPFENSEDIYALAAEAVFSPDSAMHPLCLLAANELQTHIQQRDWPHNFGLSGDLENVLGKMFGVLVVRTADNRLGYLAAYSGKLANSNTHAGFVPPIFDGMEEGGFLTAGMTLLTRMSEEINRLEDEEEINSLKALRKEHSISLQKRIYEQYNFINRAGVSKSLIEIFEEAAYKNPPAGAGECAGPKLLQYAFQQGMEPIAMAEFWWGLSAKSTWMHKEFYTPCKERCGPILNYMLS
jgi:tRNA pseudouridine32 synthase/23S rRNA pseudouridine746 synthase